MDHDRNFKELLSAFFLEFIDLFLPDIAAHMDRSYALVPMDKEIFTDVTSGDRHEVDLLMKAKVHGEEAFFLVHVKNQASAQPEFPKRMFRYFARLTEKYDLPVYPVALFSYDQPVRQEPTSHEVAFSGNIILQFHYRVIQLNRLDWRAFAHRENPIASALMAKMQMSDEDRPKVRLECLRLLASLKLDPARSKLIGGFVDSYLKLSAEELENYKREMSSLSPTEKDEAMALVSSWEQKGIDEGIIQGISQGISQGKEDTLRRQIRRRFGDVPTDVSSQMSSLTVTQIDELSEALFDFTSLDDLQQWLSRQ